MQNCVILKEENRRIVREIKTYPFRRENMKEKLQRFTGIDTFKEFVMLNVGTLLVAAGVYFFKFPSNISFHFTILVYFVFSC